MCACVLVCFLQYSQPRHDVVDILHHLIQVLEHLILVEVNQQELLQVGQLVTHSHVWLHYQGQYTSMERDTTHSANMVKYRYPDSCNPCSLSHSTER